jgi:hypothetical protein
MVNFIKALKKMGLSGHSVHASEVITSYDDDFFFEISVSDLSLEIGWLVNPMVYLDPAAPPPAKPGSKFTRK